MTDYTKIITRIEQSDSVWLVTHGEDGPVTEADHERLSDYERAAVLDALRRVQNALASGKCGGDQ